MRLKIANYSLFSSIKHLWSHLHLPFLKKGLVPKCLFIKTPKTTPDKKIEPIIRTIDKRVKPLRISTLRSVSSVSNINSPFGDYSTNKKANEKGDQK